MIAFLLALTLAAAAPVAPDDLSTDRKNPTTVWIREPTRPLVNRSAYACGQDLESFTLPVGLRADAFLVKTECGRPFVFLDLPFEGVGRAKWLQVGLDQISLTPPRTAPWPDPPVAEGVMNTPRGKRIPGMTFDRPGNEEIYLFLPYERVEILDDDGVIRTSGGRLVAVSPNWVQRELPSYVRLSPEERAALDRLTSTRRRWEKNGLITAIPSSEELLANEKVYRGRVFALEFDLDDLHSPRYSREWVDPVAHELTRDCSKGPTAFEACGHYLFEYAPFGAWVPDAYGEILARFDGVETIDGLVLPKLTVLVKRPFGNGLRISEEWAPRP